MNFLSDVLSLAEDAETLTLTKKLPLISSQIATCKQEVLKNIDDTYCKYIEWPIHNQKLLNVSSQLSSDLDDLQKRIEEVTIKEVEKNNVDICSLSEELDKSNVELMIVTRIIQIHEGLVAVRSLQQDKQHIKAAYAIINLEVIVGSIADDEVTDTFRVLKENVQQARLTILDDLYDMFHQVIQTQSKVSNNVQTNTIKITKKHESITELFEVLEAFKGYTQTLDRVCKFVLEVCKGVIHNVTTIKLHDEGAYHVIVIAIKKTIVNCKHDEVFAKLTEIFAFLYSYFDYSINDDLTTLRYFGNNFGEKFSEILVNDCLEHTKPVTETDFANYETTNKSIITFQQKLVEFNIFESNNDVIHYVRKMDELLIEQKCNQYLADAISLMKKDLHDSLSVGVKAGDGNLLAPEQFPRSVVSRSVIDIIDLVRTLLDEAQEVSDQCAARLICTAQSIFYQYGSIVHSHHERLLLTIPQQVALFRNNCLYIAHTLTQLNEEYSSKFPASSVPLPPLFTDQGHQLQTIGGEIFLGYIDDQVRLMEVMVEQYLSTAQVSDKLNPELEKLIRQCLRQYELLRTVWLKILPHAFYNKSIGYLFNAFCKKLIITIVNASDIPSKNAEQLVETFKVVLTRGPKLFSNAQEINLYVESWAKLNDLVYILGANLAGISDMWSDGKGVLTLTFPPDEVRSLIKALFQNTARRAAVLNKIH